VTFGFVEREENVLKDIGDRLVKLRIKKGYKSSESFAFKNNFSRMHYWRIEKGLTNITMKTLLKILDVHHISIKEFFSEDPES
jgi:transcriptional regulator with XRE-family HTH domain